MATTTDTWLELPDAPPIDGLRFRRPRADDEEYEALAELICADSRADDIPWLPSGEMLREEWEEDLEAADPRFDFVVAEVDGAPVAVAGHDRGVAGGEAGLPPVGSRPSRLASARYRPGDAGREPPPGDGARDRA